MTALYGLIYAQRRLRRVLRLPNSRDRAATLDYFLSTEIPHHAAKLPSGVTDRLDQVGLTLLSRRIGRQIDVKVAEQIASSEAIAQSIRAANHYRQKEGLPPKSEDDWPE